MSLRLAEVNVSRVAFLPTGRRKLTNPTMVSHHSQIQHYNRHYAKAVVTGLFGCRWQRYKQSKDETPKVGGRRKVVMLVCGWRDTCSLLYWRATVYLSPFLLLSLSQPLSLSLSLILPLSPVFYLSLELTLPSLSLSLHLSLPPSFSLSLSL